MSRKVARPLLPLSELRQTIRGGKCGDSVGASVCRGSMLALKQVGMAVLPRWAIASLRDSGSLLSIYVLLSVRWGGPASFVVVVSEKFATTG